MKPQYETQPVSPVGITLKKVQVKPGHWEDRERQVVVCAGHYQDVCPPCRRKNLALLQDDLLQAERRARAERRGGA